MRWFWTVDDGVRSPFEVVVDGEPDAPVDTFASALGLPLAAIAPRASADASAADAAPESGAVLPLRHLPVRVGEFAIRFRGGPLGGQVVPVARTRVTIGRADVNDLVLGDCAVSRHHAVLEFTGDTVRVVPVEGARPTRVNGVPVDPAGAALAAHDLVELGASVLSVGATDSAGADVRRGGSGELAFNRPARIRRRPRENRVVFPGKRPEEPLSAPVPWAMATIPLVLGGVIAYVAHAPVMLLMALASPVMVVVNFRSQRSLNRRRGKSATATWLRSTEQATQKLAEISDMERDEAWRAAPDPATVREWCVGRAARLWERRAEDPDSLSLRLGLAEIPVPVKVDGHGADANQEPLTPVMSPVPVNVDLRAGEVVGIAAPTAVRQALGRWVVLQLAALRSPRDLRLVVLCDWADEASWRWTMWLPHLRVDANDAPAALIGNTAESRAARLAELVMLIEDRQQMRTDNRDARFSPEIVVVIDGARRSRSEAGMTSVLRDGPSVGIYAVCLDDDRVRLPEEANAELIVDQSDPTLGLLDVTGLGGPPRVLLDGVSAEVAEECARGLAPIVHVGGDGDARALPAAVRLVDVLGIDLDDPEWVATRWALGGRTTKATIGAGLDGPFVVDLKLDGPHALVAGTTGAGKSELLQTLVAGLALGNRPDAMQFVLVDYKGASAFADCERLPHVVGMVTNLDNRETERALVSLDAELERRERVLKGMGAKDVDDAWDRDPAAASAGGLARLLLVIDEFAELVHELPEFVTGLIRIARVGRSLGIHLILATQRPAGVVSAEMKANLALRIALRMADKENSSEVLGAPDAAVISPSTPGRGYVRRASGAAPVGFQTARVAGRRPGLHAASAALPRVQPISWQDVGQPLAPRSAHPASSDPNATDLHALVGMVGAAAERLGIAPGNSPWLPPLPEVVTLADLADLAGRHGDADEIVLGLLDVPDEQAQVGLSYRIGHDGHVVIAGSARSGRSTVLRSVIAEVASGFAADDVHLYCLDFGNALMPARELPHCGAVVSGLETDRVARLLSRLGDEIAQRQQVLARHGFGDLNEQRAHAVQHGETPLPHVFVLIDRWEGLTSAYSLEEMQGLREQVIKVLREGPAVGVAVIVTGDRALLNDRIVAFIETRYTLRLSDREDYRLVNIRPHALPEKIAPGRAYFGQPTNEVQFAVVSADASGQAQAAALRDIVARARERAAAPAVRPFRLDVLPSMITLAEASALPDAMTVDESALPLMVGVGGDDLSRYRIDFRPGPGFLVAGGRQTGRSTALAAAATTWHAEGLPVLVVAPRPSALASTATRLGLPLVTTTDAYAAQAVGKWLAENERCSVIVDDSEAVHGSALDDMLIEAARTRMPGSIAMMVAINLDDLGMLLRGVAVEAKRGKQGLLLSPNSSMDGSAIGSPVPRGLLGRASAGRGALLVTGEWVPVQVPFPAEVAG